MHILRLLFTTLTKTPLYPHWLNLKNKERGLKRLIPYFSGKVLETGAGNCANRDYILMRSKKISKYTATDYSSWDSEFEQQKKQLTFLGVNLNAFFATTPKSVEKLDMVCDALDLPFKKSTFDTYYCSEVIEHINAPQKLLNEASRVLKRGGHCLLQAPYLFQEHGGIAMDFQRISRGGYTHMASLAGFKVIDIYTYSYFGTMWASLTNQYVIRKIMEGKFLLVKLLLLLISPIIFFTVNILGYTVELFDKDIRFAHRFFVVLQKK